MRGLLKTAKYRIDPRDMSGWAVFGLVFVATCLIWWKFQGTLEENARKRFDEIAVTQRDILIDRMRDYEQVLLGTAGLFAASQSVDREEWRDYVNSLRLHQTLPGIQGVGYAKMVPDVNKAAHEAKIRSEGFPGYVISPSGDRPLYSSIIYLEPFSGRNLRAFGYDMFSEPVRHAAMQRAADTQEPAWSDKVILVQEEGKGKTQPGFLVYVPIYAKNQPLRTVEERRAALQGFVYSPFRAWDLLGQLYQNPARLFEIELYAGTPIPDNLLYESALPDHEAKFRIDLPVDIGGAHWTARFSSNANFIQSEHSNLLLYLFLSVIGLECLIFATFIMDARHRRHVESATRELERSNHEIRLLASLSKLLQNCNRDEEAYPILTRLMTDLFPGLRGACYLLNHSETQLFRVSSWGDAPEALPDSFLPDDCWAFRRGQKHEVGGEAESDVCCHHVTPETRRYVCMPLLAQGKVIGTFYLEPQNDPVQNQGLLAHDIELLASVSDTTGLSLSNMRLRNSLRDLSIRDSLTGLYNRRYMEESLERELDRAQRQGHEVAIVMLDVDHFKKLNDTYSHEAGDFMLKRISDQMKHFRRGSDVVCRYGGEEFLLILPDIATTVLETRLENLRKDIEQMQVNFEGRILPVTTVSMGVARYPLDGLESMELIRLADTAMYRAKENGRNRIQWTDTQP